MELDEAIKHCEEVAHAKREQSKIAYTVAHQMNEKPNKSCEKCAEEHEQLAEWLKQLQEVKKIVDEWHTIRDIQDADDAMAYYFQQILDVFKE